LERRWAGGRGQGLVTTGSGQSEEIEARRARRGCWATGKRRRKRERRKLGWVWNIKGKGIFLL
jgi:hypothetical protein